MQLYHSTDRDGITMVRPSVAAMQAVLEQLNEENAAEADYPEVCLMNDTLGWSLLVYPSAVVSLEIDQAPDSVQHLQLEHCTHALKLWKLLAQGNTQALMQYPWQTNE
jgi:hypothetical protein